MKYHFAKELYSSYLVLNKSWKTTFPLLEHVWNVSNFQYLFSTGNQELFSTVLVLARWVGLTKKRNGDAIKANCAPKLWCKFVI